MIKLLFNTLSIYLCIRILKNQNYGNKGILRKGDVFRIPSSPSSQRKLHIPTKPQKSLRPFLSPTRGTERVVKTIEDRWGKYSTKGGFPLLP